MRMGAFRTRSGRPGDPNLPAYEVVMAAYHHVESREGDFQLHTHVVVLNMAVDARDGEFRAIDPLYMFRWKAAIAAAYRAELAAILREKLRVETVPSGRNFRIAGVDEKLCKHFSKRRAQVIKEMGSTDTATHRKEARIAALATRKEKKSRLFDERLADWHAEAMREGFDLTSIDILVNGRRRPIDVAFQPTSHAQLTEAVQTGLADAMEKSVVFTPERLYRYALEGAQCIGVLRDIEPIIAKEAAQFLPVYDAHGAVRHYVLPQHIEKEHAMSRAALNGRGRWHHAVRAQAALGRHEVGLSTEQLDGARHLLGTDNVVALEAWAGTGKTTTMRSVAAAAREVGLTVRVCAPSNRATRIVQADTKTPDDDASSIQKFAQDLRAGKTSINAQDLIIIDECGMVGLDDLADVINAAAVSDAKVILSGDTRQLAPVSAGSPMSALVSLLGAANISTIRRQTTSWMRTASEELARRDAASALRRYDRAGSIELHRTAELTIDAAMDAAWRIASSEGPFSIEKLPPLIAARRETVHALNAEIRARVKNTGLLTVKGSISAVPHNESEPVDLELAIGDRVLFADSVLLGEAAVTNGDTATVTDWHQTERGPVITFALDRRDAAGSSIIAVLDVAEFGQKRKGRRNRKLALQHAYAVTVHSSQGMTAPRTVVVNTGTMSSELLYVAMTRHREDVTLVVDAGRLLERPGRIYRLDAVDFGEGEEPVVPVGPLSPPERSAALKRLAEEGSRQTQKHNPSDFLRSCEHWLASDDPIGEFQRQQQPATSTDRLRERISCRRARPGDAHVVRETIDRLALSANLTSVTNREGRAMPVVGHSDGSVAPDVGHRTSQSLTDHHHPIILAVRRRSGERVARVIEAMKNAVNQIVDAATRARRNAASADEARSALAVLRDRFLPMERDAPSSEPVVARRRASTGARSGGIGRTMATAPTPLGLASGSSHVQIDRTSATNVHPWKNSRQPTAVEEDPRHLQTVHEIDFADTWNEILQLAIEEVNGERLPETQTEDIFVIESEERSAVAPGGIKPPDEEPPALLKEADEAPELYEKESGAKTSTGMVPGGSQSEAPATGSAPMSASDDVTLTAGRQSTDERGLTPLDAPAMEPRRGFPTSKRSHVENQQQDGVLAGAENAPGAPPPHVRSDGTTFAEARRNLMLAAARERAEASDKFSDGVRATIVGPGRSDRLPPRPAGPKHRDTSPNQRGPLAGEGGNPPSEGTGEPRTSGAVQSSRLNAGSTGGTVPAAASLPENTKAVAAGQRKPGSWEAFRKRVGRVLGEPIGGQDDNLTNRAHTPPASEAAPGPTQSSRPENKPKPSQQIIERTAAAGVTRPAPAERTVASPADARSSVAARKPTTAMSEAIRRAQSLPIPGLSLQIDAQSERGLREKLHPQFSDPARPPKPTDRPAAQPPTTPRPRPAGKAGTASKPAASSKKGPGKGRD